MKIAKYELKVVHKKKLILTMEDDVDSEELLKIFLETQLKEEKEQNELLGIIAEKVSEEGCTEQCESCQKYCPASEECIWQNSYPYKDLLKSLDLPDIHFHQLRNTYATILLKNSFNSKGVSHLLGHAKEIISVDIYGDTQEIIEDCLDVLEPFIEEVIPKERKNQYYDYSEVIEIDLILEEYFNAA